MSNKSLIILIVSVLFSYSIFAQTQTGYVRTVGRPDNKSGERLSGVEIRVSGLHGAVVSEEDGAFDFDLQGGKDWYQLTNVWLDNYELNEKEVIGRTFGVTKVPQEIVMVSLAEKNKIRRKVEEQVETRYKARYDELEEKLKVNELKIEDYQKQIQELQSLYEKREQMVNDMVERYSHTDYATLKPIEARINYFIEQGDLEKADSVINTLNISKLESDRTTLIERIKKTESRLKREKKSKESIDSTLLVAYQGKINIFKANFQNDSVAVYYEKLIAIDTTNVSYLLEAGNFFQHYVADYDRAMSLIKKAFEQAIAQYGEAHPIVATCYNNFGSLLGEQGEYSQALDYCETSLKIRVKEYGENHPDVASCYINIGTISEKKGEYDKALEYYKKATAIRESSYGTSHPDVASCFNSIGAVYRYQGSYAKALEYFDMSLKILTDANDPNSPDIALCYLNIGAVYDDMGKFASALEYYEKALNTFVQVYEEYHPSVASCYNNIGYLYGEQGDYVASKSYFEKSLKIREYIYGSFHPDVAVSYNNIGYVHSQNGDYSNALLMYNQALAIDLKIYGENHPDVATCYNNIGAVYNSQKEYDKALYYYKNALNVLTSIYSDTNPTIATCINNIGTVYGKQENYVMALRCFEDALKMRLKLYTDPHPAIALSYFNIGFILEKQKDYTRALDNYEKALKIRRQIYGNNHIDVATSYTQIGDIYTETERFTEAFENYDNARKVLINIFGEGHPKVAEFCYATAGVFYIHHDYGKSASYYLSAEEIWETSPQQFDKQLFVTRMLAYSSLTAADDVKSLEYIKDKVYCLRIVEGLALSQKGYSGDIYILELNDWTIDSNKDLYNSISMSGNSGKTVVFIQDGIIYKEYFENSFGAEFGLKLIAGSERQEIIKLYMEWKAQILAQGRN